MRVEYLGRGHLRLTLDAQETQRFKGGDMHWVLSDRDVATASQVYPVNLVVVWSENTDQCLAELAWP